MAMQFPEKLEYLDVNPSRPRFPDDTLKSLKFLFVNSGSFTSLELQLANAIICNDLTTATSIIDNENFDINGQDYQHFIGAAAYGRLEIVKHMVKICKLHVVPCLDAIKIAKRNNDQAMVEYLENLSAVLAHIN